MEKSVICEICGKQEKKYKCPKCSILYCSLPCYKEHMTLTCETRREAAAIAQVLEQQHSNESVAMDTNDVLQEQEDLVPISTLQKLEENERLMELLHNHHLREYLLKINSSPDPAKAMERAMHEPLFLEFADECLKVVEPGQFTDSC